MKLHPVTVHTPHGQGRLHHQILGSIFGRTGVVTRHVRVGAVRSASNHPKFGCPNTCTVTRPYSLPRRHGTIPAASTAAAAESAALRSQQMQEVLETDFDLPLAIALAAAAFEAYCEPSGSDAGLRERLLNNTFVTYTDEKFLLDHYAGLLRLKIVGAQGLKAVNITGGSDPYVVATLGDSSATTSVLWGDLDPTWNESHTLYVTNTDRDVLRLRVLDKNNLLSDVDLGVVMISVAELLENENKEMTLELRGTNAQGHLTISADFLPFNSELLNAAIAEGTQIPCADGPDSLAAFGDQLQTALEVQETVVTEVSKAAAVAAAAGGDIMQAVEETAEQLQEKLAPVQEKLAPAAMQAAAAVKTIAANLPKAAAKTDKQQQQQPAPPPPQLGDVVQEAKQQAVEDLGGALQNLEQQLKATGLHDQAAVVAQSKSEVLGKVEEAADHVREVVESEGLEQLPATDLTTLILKLTARKTSDPNASAAAAAATAAAAAAAAVPALSPEAMPGAWKALASVAGKIVEDVFSPVAYVENVATDTQVWVQVSRDQREVVVAFRGTEQVKWKDFVSDINLIPQTLDVERTGGIELGIGTIPLPFATFKKNKELMVHSGFLSAYDSVKSKVLKLVDQLTADATVDQPWKIFVTGHSLGGALATLCAYDLAGRRDVSAGCREIIMYTFGAPRVGNKAFADAFNTRIGKGKSWRITNKSDIVPSVPRLMGYAHVLTGVRLDSEGLLTFEEQSKDVLGEGREVVEVITELASQALEVAQGQRALEDVVDAIQEHEMAILNALVDGSALGQHMEDFYLATLKEAVLAADPALAGRVAAALEAAAAKVADTADGGSSSGGAAAAAAAS